MFLNVSHLFSRLFFIPTIILHATPFIPALIILITSVCLNSFSVHFGDEPIFYSNDHAVWRHTIRTTIDNTAPANRNSDDGEINDDFTEAEKCTFYRGERTRYYNICRNK